MANKTNSKIGNTTKAPLQWQLKSISRIRQDIQSWNRALNLARNVEFTQNYQLQLLYNEICIDAHLTSQMGGRKEQLWSSDFVVTTGGKPNEAAIEALTNMPAFQQIIEAIQDSIYYGYSLIQLDMQEGNLVVDDIPRTNVIPQTGQFFADYGDTTNPIHYRQLPEFGTWLLEINSISLAKSDFGLLNKAVPHVLFKRFAQSCWSELAEIYGIPPRVLKTNTQDAGMMKRAQAMLRDMGAAAYFIIDEVEALEFANGVSTDGSVYNNLITLCDNQNSLLISGAIIGQDTKYGNYSKDKAGQDVLWLRVLADMRHVQQHMNATVMPALAKHGIVPQGSIFSYPKAEDTAQLFKFIQPFVNSKKYRVPVEWLRDKFGIEVEEVKAADGQGNPKDPKPGDDKEDKDDPAAAADPLKGFFD